MWNLLPTHTNAENAMLMHLPSNRNAGFVLLEALIAVAIFSFALIGLMGMQALSIKNSADAKYRADAAYFANQIISRMWVDRANLSSYAYRADQDACNTSTTAPTYAAVTNWLAEAAASLPGVKAGAASSQKPQIIVDTTTTTVYATVTVTMCWRLPTDTEAHMHVTTAQINN
jgi:type IV pilus assembly protein PilV